MEQKLIREAHEAKLLKRLLKKLDEYAGITHLELNIICAMFPADEEGEGE